MKLVKVYIEVVSDDFEWVTAVIEKTRDWETDRYIKLASDFLEVMHPCEDDIEILEEILEGKRKSYYKSYDAYDADMGKEYCYLVHQYLPEEYEDKGLNISKIKTEDYLEILKGWVSGYKALRSGLY